MSDWDHTFSMISKILNHDAAPGRESRLKTAFEQAAKAGHDVLVETISYPRPWAFDESFMMPGLVDAPGPVHDFFGMGQKEDFDLRRFQDFFRKESVAVHGIYDLKKPFDAAKGGAELLPAIVEKTMRDIVYERHYETLSLWRKALLLSPARRDAYKKTLSIYTPA